MEDFCVGYHSLVRAAVPGASLACGHLIRAAPIAVSDPKRSIGEDVILSRESFISLPPIPSGLGKQPMQKSRRSRLPGDE